MEVADREAETGVDLEPPVGSDHDDARRLEGIVLGKHQLSMVIATWRKGGCGHH